MVGSIRFISGGLVFGSFVVCGMGFQQIWRPTFSFPPFSSHPLYLGIEFEEDLKPILVYFIWFWFLTNLKNSFAVCVEKGYSGFVKWLFAACVEKESSRFVGLWKDYLLCVLRRDLLGLWKGVFWVYEWLFVGFVKRGFFGLPIRREKCSDLEIDVAKNMLN